MIEQPWRGVWREAVLLVLVVLAAVRVLTLAHGQWESDEVLLVEAVRKGIDVRVDRPPAPGSPLLVDMARVMTSLGAFPFEATRAVSAAGSYAAALGVGFLVLALGAPGIAALLATLLYAFIPAVWLHGGRPGADAWTAATFLFSTAFFLRSLRVRPRLYFFLGALFLAFAAGLKPEVAFALLPMAFFAAWRLRRGIERYESRGASILPTLTVSILVVAISCGLFWRTTIRKSGGWGPFRDRIEARYEHQAKRRSAPALEQSGRLGIGHILGVPSGSLAPEVWGRWFRDPFGNTGVFTVVALLALGGLLAVPHQGLRLVGVFLPVLAVTLPFGPLDSAPRSAAIVLPLIAGLAALALERIGHVWHWPGAILSTGLLTALATVGLPGVVAESTLSSPPVAFATALRSIPSYQGRAVVFDRELGVHVEHLLEGFPHRELRDAEPALVGNDELVATADEPLFGVRPLATFGTRDVSIARYSGLRPLVIHLYGAIGGIGVIRARTEGGARFELASGDVVLVPRSALVLEGQRGPIRLNAEAHTNSGLATLRADTARGSEAWGPTPRLPVAISLVLVPDEKRRLVRLSASSGTIRLTQAQLTALPSMPPPVSADAAIPCAIDEPNENGEVRGELIVKGWCQEQGGKTVVPAEFRLDGVRLRPSRLVRYARPDLTASNPGLGDLSQAGFEASFSGRALRPGPHSLAVTFLTPDGRRKSLPARRFIWGG